MKPLNIALPCTEDLVLAKMRFDTVSLQLKSTKATTLSAQSTKNGFITFEAEKGREKGKC